MSLCLQHNNRQKTKSEVEKNNRNLKKTLSEYFNSDNAMIKAPTLCKLHLQTLPVFLPRGICVSSLTRSSQSSC